MTTMILSENVKKKLLAFLHAMKAPDLVSAYLFFLEASRHLHPVILLTEKKIYSTEEEALQAAEHQHLLWKETEIKIGFTQPSVNKETKKIYICPFSGKVFGDNTCHNPQDAIYDWVSKCPENTERIGGVKAKRFYISEDPEVIKQYVKPTKEPITKIVYSSGISGKLFNSKESAIVDFKEHYLKPISLVEVQNQNRFEIGRSLLDFMEQHLDEERISGFVGTLSEYPEFSPYIEQWTEGE